jgi:ATP-binding cassette subfamily G (WHITE) protein 2 (SNQ2)
MQTNTRMMSPRIGLSWSTYISCSVELGPNQVCTLFGASSGSITVSGQDYIKTGYDLNVDDLWRRNFIVLVGFLILFAFSQTFVIELVPVSVSVLFSECRSYDHYLCEQKYIGGGGVGFFAKDTTETKKLNAELKTRKIRKAEDERQEKIRAMDGIKKKRNLYVR